jgi:hypothetical protein
MEKLSKALERATSDAALYMTADLRKKATERGWDSDVVNSLRVVHRNDSFSVKFPDSVADKAWVAEYGDPDTTPTAVIRNYDRSAPKLEKFIMDRVATHLGDKD